MATTMLNANRNETYRVVHPLHDVPEEKVGAEQLGPMEMTPAVRVSLFVLRGYLIAMTLMLLYRVAEMAGFVHLLR